MIWPFSRRPMLADARPLYAALVAEARRPRWYREAGAEDSIDGRFAVLATIMALTDIRLGEGGEEAAALSPRLTEIFVDDMDSQLRQSGLGDPTLGKQVRAMIGMLARRINSWRAAEFSSGGENGDGANVALSRPGSFRRSCSDRITVHRRICGETGGDG